VRVRDERGAMKDRVEAITELVTEKEFGVIDAVEEMVAVWVKVWKLEGPVFL
jgi:hypothetical protein